MAQARELEVGDVVKSSRFQYGYLDERFPEGPTRELRGIIMAGVTSMIDEERISEDERVAIARTTGKTPPKVIKNSHYRNDIKRAKAEFIVIEKGHYSSSGDGGSCYADYVVIQQLKENGEFDPKGERLWFYTNGSISVVNYIGMSDIAVVRKMAHSFV